MSLHRMSSAEFARIKKQVFGICKAHSVPFQRWEDCLSVVLLKIAKNGAVENVPAYVRTAAFGTAMDVLDEHIFDEDTLRPMTVDDEDGNGEEIAPWDSRAMDMRRRSESSERRLDDLALDEFDENEPSCPYRDDPEVFWEKVTSIHRAKFVAQFSGDGPGQRSDLWNPQTGRFAGDVAAWMGRFAATSRPVIVSAWSEPTPLRLAPLEDGSARVLSVPELTWVSLMLGNRPGIEFVHGVTKPHDAYLLEYEAVKKAAQRKKVAACPGLARPNPAMGRES